MDPEELQDGEPAGWDATTMAAEAADLRRMVAELIAMPLRTFMNKVKLYNLSPRKR